MKHFLKFIIYTNKFVPAILTFGNCDDMINLYIYDNIPCRIFCHGG